MIILSHLLWGGEVVKQRCLASLTATAFSGWFWREEGSVFTGLICTHHGLWATLNHWSFLETLLVLYMSVLGLPYQSASNWVA